MRRVVILSLVLSLMLVFGLTSTAFASINMYLDFSTDPAYPTIMYTAPYNLNASVSSDSTVDRVDFTVYKVYEGGSELVLNCRASAPYSYSWWTVNLMDFDWPAGDYRIEATAENQAGETQVQTAYCKVMDNKVLIGSLLNWANSPVSNASLSFYQLGQEIWSGYYGWTDENGKFRVYDLPSGTYTVALNDGPQYSDLGTITVNDEGTVIEAAGNVFVNQLGKLEIHAPEPKVTGLLVRDGVAMANANISIQREGASYDGYYWTKTDNQGFFGLELPDGNYIIKDVSTYKTPGNYVYLVMEKTITVNGEVDLGTILVPSTNVIGAISGLKAPVNYGYNDYSGVSLSFSPVISETAENGGPYPQSYWSTAKWDSAAGQYTFGLFMPAGSYKIEAYAQGQRLEMQNEYFTVDGEEGNWTLSVMEGNEIVIVQDNKVKILVPADNVTGTVQGVNGPAAFTWITIKEASATEYDWTKYKSISTDQNGQFSLYLPDGNYLITDIYHDGINSTLNQEFCVNGTAQLNLTVSS